MIIIDDIKDFIAREKSHALTIGNFDGVHLGHQILFTKAKALSKHLIAVTFSNHTTDIFVPRKKIKKICSLQDRLERLKYFGVDTALVLPFTQNLACKTALEFLRFLKRKIPFNHLVLGENAKVGSDQISGKDSFAPLEKILQFHYHAIPLLQNENIPISSSLIRSLFKQGRKEEAHNLLGYAKNTAVE